MIRRGIILLAGLGLAACDIPTEPRWEQTWVLPAERLSLGVAELLPASVALSEDGSVFRVATTAVVVATTLGDLCESCGALDGTTAPKPEFTATIPAVSPLPQDLMAAVLVGGAVEVVLLHDFDFDPLRPSADASQRGHLVLSVTSGGAVVARDSISGNDTAFPGGTTLVAAIPVEAVAVSGALALEVLIHSPAGDETEIRASDSFAVGMAESVVDLSQVTVAATGLATGAAAASLDLDMDDGMVERVSRGALRLQIHNPFDLTGTLDLRLDLGATVIDRTVTVEPGDQSRRIELTGSELRDMMSAESVLVTAAGHLSSANGVVTITPAQEIVLEPSLELVIVVGGQEGAS